MSPTLLIIQCSKGKFLGLPIRMQWLSVQGYCIVIAIFISHSSFHYLFSYLLVEEQYPCIESYWIVICKVLKSLRHLEFWLFEKDLYILMKLEESAERSCGGMTAAEEQGKIRRKRTWKIYVGLNNWGKRTYFVRPSKASG